MKMPIKPVRSGWPWPLSRIAIMQEDPRLLRGDLSEFSAERVSAMISLLKFGSTFKTTKPGRHRISNQFVADLFRSTQPAILDVGASDGSTSLDLMASLNDAFRRYWVTDLNISVFCAAARGGVTYFSDRGGRRLLRASDRWLTYANAEDSIFPFRFVVTALLARENNATARHEVMLLQPALLRRTRHEGRLSVMMYDMFQPWPHERPDLIKVANVLNPSYFTAEELTRAIEVQCSNLADNGRLLIVDNRAGVEKFSVFRKEQRGLRLEYAHAGGADAAAYVAGAKATALVPTPASGSCRPGYPEAVSRRNEAVPTGPSPN